MEFLTALKEAKTLGLSTDEFLAIWKYEKGIPHLSENQTKKTLEMPNQGCVGGKENQTEQNFHLVDQRQSNVTNELLVQFQQMCDQTERQATLMKEIEQKQAEMREEFRRHFEVLAKHISNCVDSQTTSLKHFMTQELDLVQRELAGKMDRLTSCGEAEACDTVRQQGQQHQQQQQPRWEFVEEPQQQQQQQELKQEQEYAQWEFQQQEQQLQHQPQHQELSQPEWKHQEHIQGINIQHQEPHEESLQFAFLESFQILQQQEEQQKQKNLQLQQPHSEFQEFAQSTHQPQIPQQQKQQQRPLQSSLAQTMQEGRQQSQHQQQQEQQQEQQQGQQELFLSTLQQKAESSIPTANITPGRESPHLQAPTQETGRAAVEVQDVNNEQTATQSQLVNPLTTQSIPATGLYAEVVSKLAQRDVKQSASKSNAVTSGESLTLPAAGVKQDSSSSVRSMPGDGNVFIIRNGSSFSQSIKTFTTEFYQKSWKFCKVRVRIFFDSEGKLQVHLRVSRGEKTDSSTKTRLFTSRGYIYHTGSKEYSKLWCLENQKCRLPSQEEDEIVLRPKVSLRTGGGVYTDVTYQKLMEKEYTGGNNLQFKWSFTDKPI